jgi:hypothetical protein
MRPLQTSPVTAVMLLTILTISRPAAAQDPLGWNAPRAHDLMQRAAARRELPRGDSTLQNYQAKAKGFVYFYLDRREDNERTLVKVDQIALDLFWKRPNRTKQRIVGLRDVSRLPNRMYYHLDHLTVVQNNLGDVIKIGDGDEVRDVPHPAAPGADSIYDFRLADSVTLQLGGGQPDVRVYEVQVRPKRNDRPAFVGSVYVDRAAADLVRMTFTFTPASYVDRRLDYINISLDNGLFGGKYWLPNEQSVEIRRQIPELDFAAGAVIKGRMQIASYVFNEPLPDSVFLGRAVSAVPPAERESYPFPEDIYAGVNAEGLAPPPQMEDLRERAAELLGESKLSGLPPVRLFVPNASSVLRHNDTEGWYGGLGVTYVPSPSFRIDATGGYAFGLEKPEATVALQLGARQNTAILRAYYNDPRDIGPIAGMPGVLNTISSAFGETDYTNIYMRRGGSFTSMHAVRPGWNAGFQIVGEHQRSPLDEGRTYEMVGLVDRPLLSDAPAAWGGRVSLGGGQFRRSAADNDFFVRARLDAEARKASDDLRTDIYARFNAGVSSAVSPHQYFLIGGRETLPGYDYRSIVGETAFALGHVAAARTIAAPWLRVRILTYGAYTRNDDRSVDLVTDVGRFHASAGAGVGLLWDAIRVDVVKGAHWQTLVSVRHDFWDML